MADHVSPIPISKPFLGEEELRMVQEPLKTGWVVQGPYVRAFEEAFSAFTGIPHAAATTSCTTALHLAVAALGLSAGDEVIVPAFTWVSTANVVEYMGATPVFCDVDLDTFNIDVRQVEALVTPRTVGILPVHLFGLCADMRPLLEIARRHGLWVVEDAACGFGARYDGVHAGGFGNAGCFSFHPRKSITTGEGGMLTTRDADLDRRFRSLRDHGASRTDLERHTARKGFLLADYADLGYNYRMTDIQGALGCAQMLRARWILDRRTDLARRYDALLAGRQWLRTPAIPAGSVHGYQSYVCLFRAREPRLADVDALNEMRDAVMLDLEERGIATRQGTHAPVLQPYYRDKYRFTPELFPNAVLAERLSLSLPLYPQLTDDDLERVVSALDQAYGKIASPAAVGVGHERVS